MVYETLKPWMTSGIFVIVKSCTSEVYLCHSGNMLNALVRHIQAINTKSHEIHELNTDINLLDFYILESNIPDLKERMLRLQQCIDDYKKYPNKILNRRNSLAYKIITEVRAFRVYVYLKSTNNSRILIGVFRKMKEAKKFLLEHYPDNKVNKVVIANNQLTKETLYNMRNHIGM